MIILTDEERRKFALYLVQEAATDKDMIDTHKKLNLPGPVNEMFERKLKNDMMAKLHVARDLDRTESMTIGG